MATTSDSGYRVEHYRNTAYPCAVDGYQTFAIAHREGEPATTTRPLWTHMHGGAVGWFDSDGTPQPNDDWMREESLDELLGYAHGSELLRRVATDPSAFRLLIVSMCDRDLYGGVGLADPDNPNLLPNGDARTTNGLLATKAAIQFTLARFATAEHFLSGESAGSVGAYSVAWALQQQALPPAGIVADSYVLNQAWLGAVRDQAVPCPTAAPYIAQPEKVRARVHPELMDGTNDPDQLVSSGRLTVPIAQVWSHGDPWGCGSVSMACPLRDGTTIAMGSTDCMNEPLRRAIAAQGPSSRSLSLPLCVGAGCERHSVTLIAGTNTDPASPADYNAALLTWVRARLADP